MNRPYSEACEQNKTFILKVIQAFFKPGIEVLEIGSGSGQHAVYFAEQWPQVRWQTSDCADYIDGIVSWLAFAGLTNLPEPLILDVCQDWPQHSYDMIYTANSLHIMNDNEAEQCILGAAKCLKPGGHLAIYGPFNYNGEFSSDSNRQFDTWLKRNDPQSGIKHIETINEIAASAGLMTVDDVTMPANNRVLLWQRETLQA